MHSIPASAPATDVTGGLFSNRALLALACAAFGIGTTEFVIMGLLPEVAADLGISIPKAGTLISAYALGVTVGGPVMALLTLRLPRKATLLWLMVLFTVGNIGCALAPGYHSLMVARALTAFCHATFFGVGLVVATSVVPAGKRTQAIGITMGGLTLANVLGVPLGTLLGQAAGWRATFWVIGVIGLLAIVALARWVPSRETGAKSVLRDEFAALRNRQVWLALATSLLSSTSMFVLFTYIAPLLREVTGVAPGNVGPVLLLMGIGITIGNLVGSRLGDWKLMPSLIGAYAALTVILALFGFGSAHVLEAILLLCLWGGVSFGACALLQSRVISEARGGPNLASTLNQSAFNLGNAIGASLGGMALVRGLTLRDMPWLAAGFALIAGGVVWFAWWSERRSAGVPATGAAFVPQESA